MCGTLWLDTATDTEDLGKAYIDYITHENEGTPRLSAAKRAYISLFHGAPENLSAKNRLLAQAFALRYRRKLEADDQVCHLTFESEQMRVLDLGCGDGRTLWTLKQFGCETVGVDFDAQAAEAARSRGLDVRVGSLEQQQFPDGAFDANCSAMSSNISPTRWPP